MPTVEYSKSICWLITVRRRWLWLLPVAGWIWSALLCLPVEWWLVVCHTIPLNDNADFVVIVWTPRQLRGDVQGRHAGEIFGGPALPFRLFFFPSELKILRTFLRTSKGDQNKSVCKRSIKAPKIVFTIWSHALWNFNVIRSRPVWFVDFVNIPVK